MKLYHWTTEGRAKKILRDGLRRGSNVTVNPECAYAQYFSDWSKGLPEELRLLVIDTPLKCVKDDPWGECVHDITGEVQDKEVTCRVEPRHVKMLPEKSKQIYVELAQDYMEEP